MPHARKDLFDNDIAGLADFAAALSHPARIEILRIIGRSQKSEIACMEITSQLPLSQPACSRHIAILKKAGLLLDRTDGSYIYYRLQPQVLASFCKTMHSTLQPAMEKTKAKSKS